VYLSLAQDGQQLRQLTELVLQEKGYLLDSHISYFIISNS